MKITRRQLRRIIRETEGRLLQEKRENKDAEWDYLLSEPFKARNHLACAWCRDAKSILEVGSYRNPIHEFYDSGTAELITVVDPKAETFEETRNINGRDVQIVSLGEKLHNLEIPDHDAVIALGLGIPSPKDAFNESYQDLKNLCKNASTVVLEGAVDWPETVEQIEGIIDVLEHQKVVDIQIDYSGSEVRDENAPGKVYDNRRFVVLRKENIE